jgi:hypothetical protein
MGFWIEVNFWPFFVNYECPISPKTGDVDFVFGGLHPDEYRARKTGIADDPNSANSGWSHRDFSLVTVGV